MSDIESVSSFPSPTLRSTLVSVPAPSQEVSVSAPPQTLTRSDWRCCSQPGLTGSTRSQSRRKVKWYFEGYWRHLLIYFIHSYNIFRGQDSRRLGLSEAKKAPRELRVGGDILGDHLPTSLWGILCERNQWLCLFSSLSAGNCSSPSSSTWRCWINKYKCKKSTHTVQYDWTSRYLDDD